VAVLGGGISGLSAAFMTAKKFPDAQVTLYESSSRLGGWVRSEHLDSSDGPIIFEQGPRTLRPATRSGYKTLSASSYLGLEDDMLFTPRTSPAAINRFIYYPDSLNKLPIPQDGMFDIVWRVLTDPLFEGVLSAIWNEHGTPQRPSSLEDESLGDFLKRRTGNKHVADNIVSAVMHGIYAGDVYKLSVKSVLPVLWAMEEKYGSITSAFLAAPGEAMVNPDTHIPAAIQSALVDSKLNDRARNSCVYTFKNGMETLPLAMEKYIKTKKNANIKLETGVTNMQNSEDGKSIKVCALFPLRQPSLPTPIFSFEALPFLSYANPILCKLTRPRSQLQTTSPLNFTAMLFPLSQPINSVAS
jgi:oxygen-dependent protoporphyrinogen oxidase